MVHPPDSTDIELPSLKVVEPDIDPDDPWSDDVLDREEIADRLTSIL